MIKFGGNIMKSNHSVESRMIWNELWIKEISITIMMCLSNHKKKLTQFFSFSSPNRLSCDTALHLLANMIHIKFTYVKH